MTVRQCFTIGLATTPEEKEEALQIRFDVFVKEQGVSPSVESDEYDAIDPHWLVRDEDGVAIATARMTDKGNGVGKVERVAVLENFRSQGIGRLLLNQMEADARKQGFTTLRLHAQTQCQGFYEKLGYTVADPIVFDEDGIPHVAMDKTLN